MFVTLKSQLYILQLVWVRRIEERTLNFLYLRITPVTFFRHECLDWVPSYNSKTQLDLPC